MQAEATSDSPHLGLLADILRALAGEESLADLLRHCAESVVSRLDAAAARIWIFDGSSLTLVLQAGAGEFSPSDEPGGPIAVGSSRIGRVAQERSPYLTNAAVDNAGPEGVVAFAGYPMEIGPRLVGVLGLYFRHELPRSALDVLASVADSLALGVVRKQTEEQLRQDRLIIDALHNVGAALARELDVQRIVQAVTDAGNALSGASFGAFFYNVLNDQGETSVRYTVSGAPISAFEHLGLPANTTVLGPTFSGRPPIRCADITTDLLFGAHNPRLDVPVGRLPVRSYLAVPVVSREGEVLGGLIFGHPDVGVFTEASEQLVVGIAGHAAVGIENARLYQRARTAVITLQRNLLPRRLPDVEGASLTAAYLPASHHAEIGGDWYDALTLPNGQISIAVGDVGGHDLEAAAIMGQLRNTVRMSAVDSAGAADTLRRVDRYWTLVGGATFATVLYAGYEPSSRTLTLASAGHPPPLIIHADGSVEVVRIDPQPALGAGMAGSAVEGEELKLDLEPGATVVMFTDGLVERRDRDWDERLSSLVEAARTGADLSPTRLCDHLVTHMIGADHQADDIALLLLRVDSSA